MCVREGNAPQLRRQEQVKTLPLPPPLPPFPRFLLLQASATVAIPKEHHRFVIGKNGEKLQELELKTATKIAIPRPDDPSVNIRITGTKEGIEKARHEVLLISAEQVKASPTSPHPPGGAFPWETVPG